MLLFIYIYLYVFIVGYLGPEASRLVALVGAAQGIQRQAQTQRRCTSGKPTHQ